MTKWNRKDAKAAKKRLVVCFRGPRKQTNPCVTLCALCAFAVSLFLGFTMSKGTITGGGEDGLYSVTIERENGDVISDSAWCADLTEDLSGSVGIIEIAGDRDKGINIQPGYEGNAVYNETRDGDLYLVPPAPSKEGHQAGVYWNWAMRPGWQKWKPNYRYGTITAIDYDADTCDVALDACLATDTPDGKEMDINQASNLSGVPVSYMSCNSAAFEVGDEVVIKFEGFDWGSPKVVGFKQEPKACFGYMLVVIGTMCFVWDFRKGEIASDVHINGDPETMAAFPITTSNISEWLSGRQLVPFDPLFSQRSDDGSYDGGTQIRDEYASTPWTDMHECGDGSFGGEYGSDIIMGYTNVRDNDAFGGVNSLTVDVSSSNHTIELCPEDPPLPEDQPYYTETILGTSVTFGKKGSRFIAVNGSGETLDFYKEITITASDNKTREKYVNHADICSGITIRTTEVFPSSPYFSMDGGTKVESSSYREDCTSEYDDPVGEAPTGMDIACAAAYSEEYKAIAQLFIYKSDSGEYSTYGQADAGLDDVTVAPSGLSERGELSSALKSLAEAVDSCAVSAAFYR